MQTGYSFLLQAPQGDLPVGFTPAFTPNEMLRLGVFEGKYMTDCAHEYPPEMFEGAKFSPDKPNPKTNAFMAKSRDGLKAWKHYGWIDPQDPRGWFEWYCRFWMGRRTPDDARQIARWTRFAGRHSRVIMASQQRGDPDFRPRTRQSLLQWAHDPFPDVPTVLYRTVSEKTFTLLQLAGLA